MCNLFQDQNQIYSLGQYTVIPVATYLQFCAPTGCRRGRLAAAFPRPRRLRRPQPGPSACFARSQVHLAEFAMNSNPRPILGGLSPIETETGHRPNLPLDVSDEVMAMRTKHPDLDEHLADLKLLWQEVNESMKTVKEIRNK